MCGIVGVINHKAKKGLSQSDFKLNKAFQDMLWADQLRGRDGCGIMQLDRNLDFKTIKVKGDYNDLDDEKESTSFLQWVDCAFFTVGHNRSATKGMVNATNAHPFEEGNIILVHNGTLLDYPTKYEHKEKHLDVDSRALTEMIDVLGIEGAVNEFTGAYACVWFDKSDMSINFARNSERPLSIVEYESGFMLASEGYLAAWVASRNGLEVKTIKSIPVNTHHKILATDTKNIITKEYTPKPPKSRSIGFANYGYGYGDGIYDDGWWEREKEVKKEVPKTGGHKKERFRGVSQVDGGLYGIKDKIIVQLGSFKTSPQSSFYTVEGIIAEAAAEDFRHKVISNTALDSRVLEDFNQLYEATIASILISKTGFYLISVKDLMPVDADDDPKTAPVVSGEIVPKTETNIIPFSGPKKNDYRQCDSCDKYVITSALRVVTNTSTIGDSGQNTKMICLCEECADTIGNDITDLFDRTYKKKVEKLKHGGKAV